VILAGYGEGFEAGTRFLVTGGAGFIGSNLCEALLEAGYFVRCLDNFSTGKRENIAGFLSSPRFELMEGDIRDPDVCLAACDGIDFVSHQAAWGSVPRSIEFPLLYEDINIRGTLNVLEAARQRKVRRMALASSSSVYGDDHRLPKREGQEGKALSPYALTKQVNELYARLYNDLYGLPTIALRYFNVFGRRQDPDGAYAAVIPKFVTALKNGKAPTIHGDGLQSRDFTYIDNVIQANIKALSAQDHACGKAYNVACGGQETLLGIYQAISQAMGMENVSPVFGPPRPGDIRHSNADITLARENLGYKPEWDFGRGILAAIDWYTKGEGNGIS